MAQTESRPSKPEPMFSVIIGVTRAVLRNRVKPSTRSVPACGTDRRLFVWERIRDPAHEIWSFGFNTLPFVSWYKAGASKQHSRHLVTSANVQKVCLVCKHALGCPTESRSSFIMRKRRFRCALLQTNGTTVEPRTGSKNSTKAAQLQFAIVTAHFTGQSQGLQHD